MDEILRAKQQENQSTINILMNRVRELQCETDYMHDCTADNFHTFPVNLRYLFATMSEKTCLAAPEYCRLIFGLRCLHRETFLQVHLRILRHPIQGYPHHRVEPPQCLKSLQCARNVSECCRVVFVLESC